jgi:hypothetical protein
MQFTMGTQFIQSENTAPYPQQDIINKNLRFLQISDMSMSWEMFMLLTTSC